MPVIQKIELSNFLNGERGSSVWRPRWPYQLFDLGGVNAAMNIPNGKGKSAMVSTILSMLTADRKNMKEVRDYAFAPQRDGHYTHLRIQVLVSSADHGGADLLSLAGGEPGGDPMVFGVYGNAGEGSELKFYSYQGRLEDCPIAHAHGYHHTFVSNHAFRAQLDNAPRLFPANRQESSDRAWHDHVQTLFDMPSLHQQLVYQKLRGGEGGHGYFDVQGAPGLDYAAAVFYERLAPELLVEGMGEFGEDDEHGIEDTIHLKVSQLIVHKRASEQREQALVRAGNTLEELKKLDGARAELNDARRGYDAHRQTLSVEFAALEHILVHEPIPGMPRVPDEAMPLARAMVLQEGAWFLPDRVMAEFTGESVSDVNRRAQERSGLALAKTDRSQVIDFACHSFFSGNRRGPAGSAYPRETALTLLERTTNFTRYWTKQSAIDALTTAFDWVETHGDTNPAREVRKALQEDLAQKEIQRQALNDEFEERGRQWSNLMEQQSRIGDEQSAHREMLNSGLFTEEELADPAATGQRVAAFYTEATGEVDRHKERVIGLREVHASWEAFQREHADTTPAAVVTRIETAVVQAGEDLQDATSALATARGEAKATRPRLDAAKGTLQKAHARLERFLETAPAVAQYSEIFGDIPATGLAKQVQDDARKAHARASVIRIERGRLSRALEALQSFRRSYGDVDPTGWLADRGQNWEKLGQEIAGAAGELEDAKTRRAGLDRDVIVAGKVAREAAHIAGGDHRPLHAAIAAMKLDDERRSSVLTLFSALLHTPVYETVEEARAAAARLEQNRIETPVFERAELEAFCRTGEISLQSAYAHTWLVGIRTRQVECLLDPALVEREKTKLDGDIDQLERRIGILMQERAGYSADAAEANVARVAAEAIAEGREAKDAELAAELSDLEGRLPDLDHKSSEEVIGIIQATERHLKEFAGITETMLRSALEDAEGQKATTEAEAEAAESQVEACETAFDAAQNARDVANTAALQVGKLRKLQAYLDDPKDNPEFMHSAPGILADLEATRSTAEARTHFRFELASAFLQHGTDHAKNIESQILEHKNRRAVVQDELLPAVAEDQQKLRERIGAAEAMERSVDRLIHELMRMYRAYAEWSDELLPVDREAILATPLGAQTIAIREATTPQECAELLVQMADELDFDRDTDGRRAMDTAKSTYTNLKTRFDGSIDLALAKPDLDLSEHMRAELMRAKSTPDIVAQLQHVQQTNYDKSMAANQIALGHLEKEWEDLSGWLANFTKRLDKNFKLMQKVFGAKMDDDKKQIVTPGYQITGTVANDANIKAVMDRVVRTIEQDVTDRAGKSYTQYEEKKHKADLRKTIRNEFYRSVVTDVGIKVCMPSISRHPLLLERKMVSTGQGIAMALMWIVKMAEFTTKRWQSEQATTSAQRKRLRHTQFTIIDGAFSSLSDEGLIKDALNSIDATKGAFQLIITDHDPSYQNNFDHFPTLIVAKEYDNRFMIAEKKTRDQINAASAGLPEGALGVMNLRAVRKRTAEA